MDVSCALIDRIGEYLRIYQLWCTNPSQNSLADIPLIQIMNDYSAWMEYERTEKSKWGGQCYCRTLHTFQEVYNYIINKYLQGKECTLKSCSCVKRNTRDRSDERSHAMYKDRDSVAKVQILDAIHSSLLHAFDTGYRLTSKEQQEIDAIDGDDMENNEQLLLIDKQLEGIHNMIDRRHNAYTNMRDDLNVNVNVNVSNKNSNKNNNKNTSEQETPLKQVQIFSKFVTYVNVIDDGEVVDESEEELAESKSNSNNKGKKKKVLSNDKPIYSDGYMYFYSLYAKNSNIGHSVLNNNAKCCEFYIKPMVNSLKEEILHNKVCTLTMAAWNNVISKALLFLETNHVKNIKLRKNMSFISFDFSDFVDPTPDADTGGLTRNHILAILFYTNFTQLSYEFSKTFRKLTPRETDDALRTRHSHFREWGMHLQRTVIGFTCNRSYVKLFYHGISCEILFEGAYARFNGPASTSTNMMVAVNFAKDGLILELVNEYYYCCRHCFGCKFFSDYKNEDEWLLFNTFMQVAFNSIRHMPLRVNYQPFVQAMAILNTGINGGLNPWGKVTKKYRNLCARLINHQLKARVLPIQEKYASLKIPEYISKLWDCSCSHLAFFEVTDNRWNDVNNYMILRDFFCEVTKDGHSIAHTKYNLVKRLYSINVRLWLYWTSTLSHSLIDDIYDAFVSIDLNTEYYETVNEVTDDSNGEVIERRILIPQMHKLEQIEFLELVVRELSVDECIRTYQEKFMAKGWKFVLKVKNPFMPNDMDLAIIRMDKVQEITQ